MELLDPNGHPGMGGIISQYPFIGEVVNFTGEKLMRGGPLSQLECEFIAGEVSNYNRCSFCFQAHVAVFNELSEGRLDDSIPWNRRNVLSWVITNVVQKKEIDEALMARAANSSISKEEIMHAVAVAGTFCFYNALVTSAGGRLGTPQ